MARNTATVCRRTTSRKEFEFPCAAEYVKQGGIYNYRNRNSQSQTRRPARALRCCLHPYPRTGDYVSQIALGGPSQHALSLSRICHQNRRIARPPRCDLAPNWPSRCVFRCPDDFENGMSVACPQIDGQRVAALFVGAFFELLHFKVLQRSHVRIGEIANVNVVADAGAVRSRIVGAVD